MVDIAPPDQTVWWDTATVTVDVLAQLRLKPNDVDAARISMLVDVAGEMINDYLDQVEDQPTTSARHAAIRTLTFELYGRRDIPVMGAGGGTRVERVDTDVDQGRIGEILASLRGRRERFGVA